MKEFDFLKSTIDRYKKAGYSKQALSHLHYLESRCECLGDCLDDYRYIQPDGNLFSERSLNIISELHAIQHMLCEQKSLIYGFEKQLDNLMSIIFDAKYKQYEKPDYDSVNDDIF